MLRLPLAFAAVVFLLALPAAEDAAAEALALFEQRIMPIFRSPKPSSCVQCHLASVDLKSYILPSSEKTFLSLRDQGLIDLAQPEKSKILTLIQMGDQNSDRGAKLIHAKTRQAEYEAFAAWIKACAGDAKLRELPPLSAADLARPDKPEEVIRHNRQDRLLDSFVRNVWSQRMRCFPCHTPFELDATAPQHPKARETHAKFEEQFGQRMNFFRETPEATLRQLIASSRKPAAGHLPLINVQEPAKSLLVLKPTSKVPAKNAQGEFEKPTYSEPISHMGGLKMFVDDQSYKSFLAWIRDYARVVGDQYAAAGDLPADNWYPTKQILRVMEAPASWEETAPVQILIHAWNREAAAWEPKPIAFTQGPVNPRRIVNGTLFRLAQDGQTLNPQGESLPPGRYLIKAYLDTRHRLAAKPAEFLGPADFIGQAEIEAQWREGFPQAEQLSASRLQK